MPSIPFVTQIQNESADLVTAELADLTTYSTPARADLALYLYLYKRDADSNDTAITIDNSDPTAVTAWEFDIASTDGWYVAIVFGFPIWSAGTYAANKCVYRAGTYYKANTSTSGTPGSSVDWDVITSIIDEVLNLSSSGVYITQTNNFTTARSESGPIGDNMAQFGQIVKSGKPKNWEDAASVLFPDGLIESAWVNFRRGDNSQAQEIIDFVQQNYAAA